MGIEFDILEKARGPFCLLSEAERNKEAERPTETLEAIPGAAAVAAAAVAVAAGIAAVAAAASLFVSPHGCLASQTWPPPALSRVSSMAITGTSKGSVAAAAVSPAAAAVSPAVAAAAAAAGAAKATLRTS